MLTQSHEHSYDVHIRDVEHQVVNIPSILKAPDCLDARRHWRMYDLLRPIVQADPDASWLTIGDTGADAHALRKLGATRVTASSISDAQIRDLQKRGWIEDVEVRAINAEAIPELDEQPDYLLCKEAFHHFPRPSIALYGFLRTARKGVVLIEPTDQGHAFPLDILKRLAKRALRGETPSHNLFEETGNFIYRLSLREVTKILTALQADHFHYRFFNDFYHGRVGGYTVHDRLPLLVQKAAIATQDMASHLRLMAWGLVALVIPTGQEKEEVARDLEAAGFKERRLPRNPFL